MPGLARAVPALVPAAAIDLRMTLELCIARFWEGLGLASSREAGLHTAVCDATFREPALDAPARARALLREARPASWCWAGRSGYSRDVARSLVEGGYSLHHRLRALSVRRARDGDDGGHGLCVRRARATGRTDAWLALAAAHLGVPPAWLDGFAAQQERRPGRVMPYLVARDGEPLGSFAAVAMDNVLCVFAIALPEGPQRAAQELAALQALARAEKRSGMTRVVRFVEAPAGIPAADRLPDCIDTIDVLARALPPLACASLDAALPRLVTGEMRRPQA